jgi:hypothetical protein
VRKVPSLSLIKLVAELYSRVSLANGLSNLDHIAPHSASTIRKGEMETRKIAVQDNVYFTGLHLEAPTVMAPQNFLARTPESRATWGLKQTTARFRYRQIRGANPEPHDPEHIRPLDLYCRIHSGQQED